MCPPVLPLYRWEEIVSYSDPTIMHLSITAPHTLPCAALYCRLSRREEIVSYSDPTIMHKLQMQLAIVEERFEDATA